MSTTPTTPGALIRAARIKAGLSVAELARRLGVTPPRISNLESGHRNPSSKVLLRIAAAIPCDPHTLDPALASVAPSTRA